MPEHASRFAASLYDQQNEHRVADWGGDDLFTRMPRPRAVDNAPAPRFRPSLMLVDQPEDRRRAPAGAEWHGARDRRRSQTAADAMRERADRLGLAVVDEDDPASRGVAPRGDALTGDESVRGDATRGDGLAGDESVRGDALARYDALVADEAGHGDALASDDALRDDTPGASATAGWDPAIWEAATSATARRWDSEHEAEERAPNGRRTKVITGRPDRAPRPLSLTPAERRRPARTPAEWVGPRPERIMAWAFVLGLLLILVAISTADAATL